MRIAMLVVAATFAGGVAGCASAPESSAPKAVTVTETVVAPVATVTVAPPAEPASEPSVAEPVPAPAVVQIVVPDGVGKDYQTAQDLWRSAGLTVMPSIDGLGLDRLPVLDANWVVLSQDLPAGTSVPDGTAITATVVKFTDI